MIGCSGLACAGNIVGRIGQGDLQLLAIQLCRRQRHREVATCGDHHGAQQVTVGIAHLHGRTDFAGAVQQGAVGAHLQTGRCGWSGRVGGGDGR
ncbi:hypothetical protein D3C76_1474040 [compost metagenome]